jgi:hypothetical protein
MTARSESWAFCASGPPPTGIGLQEAQLPQRAHTRLGPTPTWKRSDSWSFARLRPAKNHIRPMIGDRQGAALDAEYLDLYHSELQRCRDHCAGPFTRRTCDARCGPMPASHWAPGLSAAIRKRCFQRTPASRTTGFYYTSSFTGNAKPFG